MIRATRVEPAAESPVDTAMTDTVQLDFDARHRRRIALSGEGGLAFLLDLEKAVRIKGGDRLVLEDGRRVLVRAAPEPLAEIHCTDLRHLVRVAWHLGNRHLPTMLDGERLLIRRDHVIEDMARGLGARVRHIEQPFDPEGGAYAGGHHHHHGDDEVPVHAHDHSLGHPSRPSHGHRHVFDPRKG